MRRWWRRGLSASAGSRHVTPPHVRPSLGDSPSPTSECPAPQHYGSSENTKLNQCFVFNIDIDLGLNLCSNIDKQ